MSMTVDDRSTAFGHARLDDFSLRGGTLHVNHGSFGAIPKPVALAQAGWRNTIEANPSRFYRTQYGPSIRTAAARVAQFLGGEACDWIFVDNATAAVNAVIASIPLAAGDEILTTDHAYEAVLKTLRHYADRAGATLVVAPLPVPVSSPDEIVDTVSNHVTTHTRLAVIDHVASRSAVVMPIARLAEQLRKRNVPVLVDGAHAPGMLDLDVVELGVDWYAGNGHKWLGAPRGCGLLWCRRDQQKTLSPLVVSHGHGHGFTAAFDWAGTRDPSAWLSVTAAIDYHQARGDAALRQRNRQLAASAAAALTEELHTEAAAAPALLGSMATVRLRDSHGLCDSTERLQIELENRYDVEASLVPLQGEVWLRISAAIYNELEDFVTAGRAAAELVAMTEASGNR